MPEEYSVLAKKSIIENSYFYSRSGRFKRNTLEKSSGIKWETIDSVHIGDYPGINGKYKIRLGTFYLNG